MNFLRRGKALPPEQKSRGQGPAIAYRSSQNVSWTQRESTTLTRAGFVSNPVGFRAVKLISEAAAAVPLVLQDGAQRYAQHPILSALDQPNLFQARGAFLEALFGQLLLTGDAFIKVSLLGGGGLELHVLRSDRVEVISGNDGWPVGYTYNVDGKKTRFDVSEDFCPICHIRAFHPQDDHRGLSPLSAASMAVDVHNSASRWSKGLLDNAARPSGAFVYSGAEGFDTLSAEQLDRLVVEIENHHQGARNAGRPMLLEGGLDWRPMGFSPSDMEFQKTKEAAAREIATAFGVPPMLLGIPGDATYANYAEANRAFYRLTVLPLVGRVGAALSQWLRGEDEPDLWLKADLDQVSALASERDQQWARVAKAEFLTRAEKRSLLGLPAEEIEAGHD
ncbi:MAG: phage portal protein [Pseudomonadota bacterium]